MFSGVGIDWIIIKVNLTSVFDHDCTQDDYKRWSPADNSTGKHRNCILGKSIQLLDHKCDRNQPVVLGIRPKSTPMPQAATAAGGQYSPLTLSDMAGLMVLR